MGIALGTRLTPVTFEIPKLQLPFEQMYAQMQGMQQEKDVYDTMKGMMPQYVSADKPLVEAGLKEVSSLVEGVSNAYSTGKVSDAMRGIRQAKGVLSEMWKPTGVFGAVQGFYQDYQKAMQEVEEFTKGNTDPAYKFVYQRAVQKAAEQGSGFDPLTGKRKTVAAPDMVKELDVITEFSKFAEGWGSAADQTVGMKKVGNYYYWVGTEKKVSEEEVQSAWRSYISSPKIQAHLGIQAAYEVGNLAPEQEQSFRDLMLKDAEGSFKQSKDSLSAIKTMLDSNNPAQIRRAQKALGVKDDGIVGDNTRKAYEELNQTLTENSEKVKQAYMEGDLTNLAKQRLEEVSLTGMRFLKKMVS
jgi:hypothetical protein